MSDFYSEKETMPIAERERYYCERLRWIVQYAYEKAPAIRDKFDQAGVAPGDIRSPKDLERIPVTTRDEFVRL